LASGTIVFWCKFGGVLGGGGESIEDSEGVDAAEEVGVDGSDILLSRPSRTILKDVFGTFQVSGQRPCCTEMGRILWRYEKSRLMTLTNFYCGRAQAVKVNSTQHLIPPLAFPCVAGILICLPDSEPSGFVLAAERHLRFWLCSVRESDLYKVRADFERRKETFTTDADVLK
jgi:hypothetical protein